jgi:hypothetical protein
VEALSIMIYTFYSFKGGVGRTMALANVAELLCSRGLNVLMVDFDLEAPGLERFFETGAWGISGNRGVIDMMCSYRELRLLPRLGASGDEHDENRDSSRPLLTEPLANFVTTIPRADEDDGELFLITAGARAGDDLERYAERVRTFDWDEFYRDEEGEQFFDWFRKEAIMLADVVLIDSRTGITEMSGVCTHQLADAVVILVAPTYQNVDGAEVVAESLRNPELIERGRGGRALPLIMVPSRIELNEHALLQQFKESFEEKLVPYNAETLEFEQDAFNDLMIPYVTFYAYMERVAVREPEHPSAKNLIAAYSTLASAMVELAPGTSALFRKFLAPLRAHVIPTGTAPIAELPPGFVDRAWVMQRIDDWLAKTDQRSLLITGGPGSGKSALAQRLVEMSEGIEPEAGYERLGPGAVTFAYACDDWIAGSVDPMHFVEVLARHLAERYPEYASAVIQQAHPAIEVEVRQSLGAGALGAPGRGVSIEQIRFPENVSAKVAFDHLIRRPLEQLYRGDFAQQIVILIDGLDAALTFSGEDSLLAVAANAVGSPPSLPAPVRFIFTSRPDARVLSAISEARVDLLDDAPKPDYDIRDYAERRLKGLSPAHRRSLADQIADKSAGLFIYARYAMDDMLPIGADSPVPPPAALPSALYDYYREEAAKIAVSQPERGFAVDRRLLGLLAVALGEGLTANQLAGSLAGSRTATLDGLRAWSPFLRGAQPVGPFRLFHDSFREFLLIDDEYRVFPADAHQSIAKYFLGQNRRDWFASDTYALRFTVDHLRAAIEASDNRSNRTDLMRQLNRLLTNSNYLDAKVAHLDIGAARSDVRRAQDVLTAFGGPRLDATVPALRTLGMGTADFTSTERGSVVFSGVDAATGAYAHPPIAIGDVLGIASGPQPLAAQTQEREHLLELSFLNRQAAEVAFAPIEGIDRNDLSEAGWGIVFAQDADPAVREALAPLLEHRRTQASTRSERRYREFIGSDGVLPGESKQAFLSRHGAGPGIVDPERVPYYLLFVGSPEAIPFHFQYHFDVQHAVGRLWFDTPEEYANYAASVLAADRGERAPARRMAFFGARGPHDPLSTATSDILLSTLASHMGETSFGWEVDQITGDATKASLAFLLSSPSAPAILVAAGHGLTLPEGHPLQRSEQGALICAGWSGPSDWETPVPRDYYFAGSDIEDEMTLAPSIVLLFASFGAGTAAPSSHDAPVASYVARLPQRLLGQDGGGVLAVIAQVDRISVVDGADPRIVSDVGVIASCLHRLLDGHPVGSAVDALNEHYAEIATTLDSELQDARFGKVPDEFVLAGLWSASSRWRSLVVLGDPAVSLTVPGPPTAADVVQETRPDFSTRALIELLLQLPIINETAGRTALLSGLPSYSLNRSFEIAVLDVSMIVEQLASLGPLSSGDDPLVVLIENALQYAPEGSQAIWGLRALRDAIITKSAQS